MTLDQLAAAFRDQTLPLNQWTHVAHLSVGAWHVHGFGADEAIVRLRTGIRALNDRHGTANTPTSGYHETITIAYVRLIEQFLARFEPQIPLEQRVNRLTTGPVSEKAFLFRFWSRELLMGPAARATWVAPDLAALVLPPDASPGVPADPGVATRGST